MALAAAGCQGLGTIGNPPDPSIAASATWAIQSVNSTAMIAGNLDTSTGVSLGGIGATNDRRVYYDRWADRWFTVGLIPSGLSYEELVTASATNDPTGPWYQYNYVGGNTPDQPSMGCAQNLCVVADRTSGIFFAQTITNLEFGVGGIPWSFAVSGGVEAIAARSRDGDLGFNYVVSAGGSGYSTINLQRLGSDLTLRNTHLDTGTYGTGTVRVGNLNIAIVGQQYGGYTLTQPPQDAYVGAGGHHLYVMVDVANGADSCLRVMDFADVAASPFAPTLQGHADYCVPGNDVWEGSLAQNVDGTLFLVAHCSGPDRKSTRLNSSHLGISYAVFCLKK